MTYHLDTLSLATVVCQEFLFMHNHTFGSILNKLGACPVQPNFVLVYVMEFGLDLENVDRQCVGLQSFLFVS